VPGAGGRRRGHLLGSLVHLRRSDQLRQHHTRAAAGCHRQAERVPANARVERFVPQDDVLPGCSLVVSHGGSGSTLGALAHGLPLLLVPRGADQFENAEACAAVGVGRVLLPPEVSADAVAGAASALLSDPHTAARAVEIALEIATMPSPAEVADRLSGG
jgi:UDP:flavonoid glycosyltransferase YjiC (YdhE family)